jgi:Flp pilus assembly pilin Flp
MLMFQLIAQITGRIRDREGGQGLAEYALILGLVAVVSIIALIFLGNSVSSALSEVGSAL